MTNYKEEQQFKVFGYGFSTVCLWMALRQWTEFGITLPSLVLLTFSVSFITLTVIKARLLKVCFQFWMKTVRYVGTAVTAIILTFVYVFIFTPVAVCLKFLGKDYMSRSWRDDRMISYWLATSQNDQDRT